MLIPPHGDRPEVIAEETFAVGTARTIDAPSPTAPFCTVFEDDGDTGYFYALDMRREGNSIVDALHIYDVLAVSDRHLPCLAQIVGSADGQASALFINGYAHAVVDFASSRACCRSNFPPPVGFGESHEWDEQMLQPFNSE